MTLTRRDTISTGAAALVLASVPPVLRAATEAEAVVADFTGDAPIGSGDLHLDAPRVAENGNLVRITVASETAREILLIAPQNPLPRVVRFTFGPLAGRPSASTRIRLARSQEVIALARLADGSFVRASAQVAVVIGGCGA